MEDILVDIEAVTARLLELKCMIKGIDKQCRTGLDERDNVILTSIFEGYCKKAGEKVSTLSDRGVIEALSDLGTHLKDEEFSHIKTQIFHEGDEWNINSFQLLSQRAQRLHFISSVLEEARLHLTLEAIFPDQIEDICKLTPHDIQSKFGSERFVLTAAEHIAKAISIKSTRTLVHARSLNSKFISDGAEFCEFGKDEEFHGGLEESIGLPDPLVLKSILYEHLHSESAQQVFLTSNYSLCTTPEVELAFVLGREDDHQFLLEQCGSEERRGPSKSELQSLKADLELLRDVHAAVLRRGSGKYPGEIGDRLTELVVSVSIPPAACPAAFAARLSSCLQEALHPSRFAAHLPDPFARQAFSLRLQKARAEPAERGPAGHVDITLPLSLAMFDAGVEGSLLDAAASSAGVERSEVRLVGTREVAWTFVDHPAPGAPELQGRRGLPLRALMASQQVRQAELRVEEAMVVHEYTGPMFMPWNGVLRKPEASRCRYTTTLHCLVSATTKLGRHTVVPAARKLWRGLGSRVLRESAFFDRDARGTRGGVERGFLSTTKKVEVAMQYSGHDHRAGTVLELDFGKVDCPAEIDALSQYPGEGEMLFGPLCYLEAVGSPRLETFLGSAVLVVPVRINCNLRAETVDEIIAKRKRSQVAMIASLVKEIEFEFSRLPPEVVADNADTNPRRVELRADARTCSVRDGAAAGACSARAGGGGLCSLTRAAARVSSARSLVLDGPSRVLFAGLSAMDRLLQDARCKDPSWFNEDEKYRAAWNEALDQKDEIVSGWWLRALLKEQDAERFGQLLALHGERHPLAALSKLARAEAVHRRLIKGSAEEAEAGYAAAMIASAREGNVVGVRLLYLLGADPSARDAEGCTALHAAAETCQADVIASLVGLKADLNARGLFPRGILDRAEATPVLKMYHPHALTPTRGSFMYPSCDHCSRAIPADAPRVLRCDACRYSLCEGCLAGSGRACVRALKLAGADGWTRLMVAAEEGDAEWLRSLLAEEGARDRVGAAEIHGKTAGHIAAARGRLDCVMLLAEAGLDVNQEDSHGVSTCDLMEGPVACRARAARGWTPLMLAAEAGDAGEVGRLLGQGDDPRAVNSSRRSALHVAARRGHADVVRMLVAAGADVSAVDDGGRSVLGMARGAACRKALMDAGADGWTPERIEAMRAHRRRLLATSAAPLGGELPRSGVVGLFFACGWADTCPRFLPKLVEVYKARKERRAGGGEAEGGGFEVVYVSLDRSSSDFDDFYATMPWLALPYRCRRAYKQLERGYGLTSVPTLVLLDAATCEVICKDAVSRIYADPQGLKFPWAPAPLKDLLGTRFLGSCGKMVDEDFGGKYLLLLFAGRWCPSCRKIVPRLLPAYNKVREVRDDVVVVFVSSDQDQNMFDAFFADMPWLALPYAERDKTKELSTRFDVSGIPSMFMIDPDGRESTVDLWSVDADGSFPWPCTPLAGGDGPRGVEIEAESESEEDTEKAEQD